MSRNDWEKTVNDLRQTIVSIKDAAQMSSVRFKEIRRQTEPLKVSFLVYWLEDQRRSIALSRGYTSVAGDGRKLGASLLSAAGGLILTGAVTRDKFAAMNGGLSSFFATLRGLGDTDWAVSLDKHLTVLPSDNITSEKTWVTWESMKSALSQLEREAQQGACLGSLDSIISRLQTCTELVYLGLPQSKLAWRRLKE